MMPVKLILLFCFVVLATAEHELEFGKINMPDLVAYLGEEFDSRLLQASMSTTTSNLTPQSSPSSTVDTSSSGTETSTTSSSTETTSTSTTTKTTTTSSTSKTSSETTSETTSGKTSETTSGTTSGTTNGVTATGQSGSLNPSGETNDGVVVSSGSGADLGVLAGAIVGAVCAVAGAGYLVHRRRQQLEGLQSGSHEYAGDFV